LPQHGLLRDALGAFPVLAVLAAVYLLPPDTSLGEVRRAGTLHVCLPPLSPPFVTGDANAPGLDVEILRALADDLGLTLAVVAEPAMGRDFNPRGWHITRAACEILAGGVVASPKPAGACCGCRAQLRRRSAICKAALSASSRHPRASSVIRSRPCCAPRTRR